MIENWLDIEEREKNQPRVGCPAVVAIVGKKSHVAVYILTLPDSDAVRFAPGPHQTVAEQYRKRRYDQQQIEAVKNRQK
jgi:hypothetical protein